MKDVRPVNTAIVAAVYSADFLVPCLCRRCILVKNRMVIDKPSDHLIRLYFLVAVQ